MEEQGDETRGDYVARPRNCKHRSCCFEANRVSRIHERSLNAIFRPRPLGSRKNVAPTSPSHASRENVWKSGLLDYFERNFLSEREIDEACEKDFYFRSVGGGGSKQRVSFERGKGGFPRLIGGKRLGNER